MSYAELAAQYVPSLIVLLAALVITRRVATDVRPIFLRVVDGVAKNAQSNATSYGIALLFGLSASFSAFWDVFHTLDNASMSYLSWHQYAALWCKVLNPFVVAVLAYATQNGFKGGGLAAPQPTPPPTASPFTPTTQ